MAIKKKAKKKRFVAKKARKDDEGMVFLGFMFLGLAAGAYYGRYDIGILAGLGTGFLMEFLWKHK